MVQVASVIAESNKILFMKWLVIIVCFIGFGCKSTKQIKRVVEPKSTVENIVDPGITEESILNQIQKDQIDYQTFSAKIKVDVVTKDGKQPELTAVVRMVKDSAIWISLSATFLNIEVYRVLVKPDQVILLNKQDKIVQYRTLEYLQEITNLPLDFSSLQNLLVGNVVYFQGPLQSFKKQGNELLLTSVGDVFKHLLVIDSKSFLKIHSKLDDVNEVRNRTASIAYSEYENVNNIHFATYRHITVAEKEKINLKLKFKQVEFNKELSVNFNVPKNYEIK